ncbi:MAG: phosphatase PAP2 family protein [Alphaproteobacteria bacterium]|nr:phosphatase PAP2 family protein [Alphaproteobacteria bacterium]
MDSIETLNRQLFLSLNAAPETAGWLIALAKFAANGLIFLLPLLLAGLWLWGNDSRRSSALRAIFTAAASLGVNFLIGMLWYHPRPLALELGHTYFHHALDASFPSDHATIFFAAGFALLQGGTRPIGFALLLTGALVGWARIFLGVHFPLDMLGALAVSAAVCFGVSLLWDKTGKNITGYCLRLYRVILAPLISLGWIRS